MRRRSGPALLAVAMLLALGLPAAAQGDTSSVRFDGIGFSFDHALGRSVNILRVPSQRPGRAQVGEASPAHVAFALYPRQREGRAVPRVWDVPGVVRAYRTSGLDRYPMATQQLERLRQLLADRPDPSTLGSIDDDAITRMPYLPIEEAAQAIAARIQYVDTPELAGLSYVTGFRQDTFPFARNDLWYTFQGLSTDGRWYVAVAWSLRAEGFPARVSNAEARRAGRNARTWRRYIERTVATLDAAQPTGFRPSLDTLDALVRSIDFDSVTQGGEPTAQPSTEPTAQPSVQPSAAPSAIPSTAPVPSTAP